MTIEKMRIEREIRQKAFKNEYLKAHVNILFSSSWIRKQLTQWLWPFDISPQQFNILRILRGKYPESAMLKELTEKMIDKMSNTSRLVEKLRRKKMVERTIPKNDRRKVNIIITERGLEVVEEASKAVERKIIYSMQALSTEETEVLNELLDKMRG